MWLAQKACQEPSIRAPDAKSATHRDRAMYSIYTHSFQDDGIMGGYLSHLWHHMDATLGGLPEAHSTQAMTTFGCTCLSWP